jgi:hypothetical protein
MDLTYSGFACDAKLNHACVDMHLRFPLNSLAAAMIYPAGEIVLSLTCVNPERDLSGHWVSAREPFQSFEFRDAHVTTAQLYGAAVNRAVERNSQFASGRSGSEVYLARGK